MDRRGFLTLACGLGLGLAAGCTREAKPAPGATGGLLRPGGAAGTIEAGKFDIDLGGRVISTWGYNATVPGPELRVRQGETVRVRLANRLTEATTIHWHGISVPNAMDGVEGVTQDPVAPGGGFDYEFIAADAGSYMYHAHHGHQLDLGLYGPLIVEPREPEALAYDRDYTLMLDDWRDGLGLGATPGAHGGHTVGGTDTDPDADEGADEEAEPAQDTGDALTNPGPRSGGRAYPLFLVNGRPAADPASFEVRTGERVRLRLMNIAADTGFLVALAGHRLTVTHTDGMAVEAVTVDAVRLGMGERYDVLVEARNPGTWQLAAVPEAKAGLARAVLRYTDSAAEAPGVDLRPAELGGRVLDYADLRYAGSRPRPTGPPDRVHELVLSGNSMINAQRYPNADPLEVSAGELVRVEMRNDAAAWHPMHLHGHHFWVATASGRGPLKETMNVPGRGGRASFEFVADNTGRWMFHCHNHYHMDNGMARLFSYL